MRRTLTSREALFVRACLDESDGWRDLSGWTRAVLGEVRSGLRALPALLHPLGFTCIQLYRGSDWGLCIHIWADPAAPTALTTTPIHSHSWDLSSQVVCGSLENIEIAVIDDPPSPTHRILEVTSTRRSDQIHPTRRLVRWTRSRITRIRAGQNYVLPAGTFHVSQPTAGGPSATVLLAEYRRPAPELALGRLDSHDHVVTRRRCAATELRRLSDLTLREMVNDPLGGGGAVIT